MSSPLRDWMLDTTYDDTGHRYHQRPSRLECWQAVRCLGNGSFGDVWEERCLKNLLVSSPGPNWHVKVADFGIAKKTGATGLGTHHIGSPVYIAPELYGNPSDKYTAAVDVWALGALAKK
ncbi:hypothetical protein BDW59DRAFT_157152 [Aspergillus cavernicola]|uniref:non-specific serine/threonine protein kinase n=1 Tax=Aspergillus cavernicola TaxID=176166 RepID=A0ABR4IZ20_9EURO